MLACCVSLDLPQHLQHELETNRITLAISYWILKSRGWSKQGLLGWDVFRGWEGSSSWGFFCCSILEQQQRHRRCSSWLSLKQRVLSYGNIFLYYICTEFSLFWSPSIFRFARCSVLISFARCYKIYILCLLMYYKCKAKFWLSNKCALWWYLVYCFVNLNWLVLNMKRKNLSLLGLSC